MRFDNKLLLSMTAALVPLLVACPAQPPAPQEVPKSAVVKAFSASPAEVAPGESATLTWEVEDTKSVSITTLNGEPIPVPDPAASKGTVAIEVEATTVYVLTAHGEGGSDTAVSSVLVRQNGESIFCTITPQEIEAGQPVTVVWNAAGAGQVTITNAEGEEIYAGAQVQGSKTFTPSFSTTYTCAADSKTATTTLQVNPKIVAFEADASSVASGGKVTLRWKVGGAQSVSLVAEGRGAIFSGNKPAEIADGTFTETVPSNLPANAVLTYRLDASTGETTLSRSLEVYVGANPRFVQLVVPPYAREAGVFNVEWKTEQANQVFVLVDGKPVYVATAPAEVAQGVLTLASPATQLEVELKATSARGGEAVSAKYTVGAVGEPALNGPVTATPAMIANGGEVSTLSWSISNARRVRVLDSHGAVLTEVTGMEAEAGSLDVYPNEATTIYTVEADNQAGDVILPSPTVTVDVTSPATLTWASPEFPAAGPIVVAGHTAVNAGAVYGLPSVVKNAPGEAFVDIRPNGTPVKVPPETGTVSYVRRFGEMSALVHGVRAWHESISVNVDGYLVFSTTVQTGWNDNTVNFPKNQLPPLTVAPYFDDLIAKRDGSSEIYFRADGTGLNRRLIVQWENFTHPKYPGSLLTFQAQVYESGKIVFAYKTLQRLDGNDPGVGVVNDDQTGGLVAPDFPAEGDTYTFFGPATLPLTMAPIDAPWSARIQVGTSDHYINVTAAPPTYLPPVQ